jgi:hypothetical protein
MPAVAHPENIRFLVGRRDDLAMALDCLGYIKK